MFIQFQDYKVLIDTVYYQNIYMIFWEYYLVNYEAVSSYNVNSLQYIANN